MSTSVLFVASNTGEGRQAAAAFRRAGYEVVTGEILPVGRHALHAREHALAIVDGALLEGPDLDLLVAASGTPIVLLSDENDVSARLDARRAGAVDCVSKPYDPLHLVARAVSVMNARKGMPPVSAPGFARRLLLVDDSITDANALADELRKDGHDVALARAGHEAISFVVVQDLDIILVDAFLPDMSGVDLCTRLRAIPALRRTPVLLLTGQEKSAARGRVIEAEASDLVVKSRDPESVRMHVRRMLPSDDRPAPSSRREDPPASHRSVPPPASHRSVPPPASHRSVPPPASHRSVPPPPSRRDGPPSSRRDAPLSSRRAQSRRGETESALFEQVAAASGLSKLVARGAVERACWRVGVKPSRLAPRDLERLVPEMEQALRVFLPSDVVAIRMAEMARLGRG